VKEILITGACGYLGARLSKYLAECGYRITAFDRFDPSGYTGWTSLMEEVVVGDIRLEHTILELGKKKYDVVIHLISLDHHKSEVNPNFVSSVNVMPTWNLLHTLTRNGLQDFIYFSTVHVYGKIPNKIITEEHIPAPQNVYGLTHLLSENICNYFNFVTKTNCRIVRPSNTYGSPIFKENDCWWLAINDFCRTAFEEKKIRLLSEGSAQRDFIHISDACRAVELLIKSEGSIFQDNVFHIASGNTLTILEIAHEIKEIFNKRYRKEIEIILPDNSVSKDSGKYRNMEKYSIDIKKIKSIGFQQKTKLDTGLNELFDFLEKHEIMSKGITP
jgi:UDP-glucose 4-epimerase